ncbi:Ankyrin repeat family protein [Euphorbia peplus]|nr:Ankyrin repeat family protein [Euphorbia peplus]
MSEVIIDIEVKERKKNAHMVVAALIVTVTFAAGFTMPGGHNGEKGSAILSRNAAFKTFIVTDAMALLMSTCAQFFHFTWGHEALSKRRMNQFINVAALLIMFAIILMLIAFAAGVYAVLPDSLNFGASICVITSIFVLVCYRPFKVIFYL